MEIATRVNGLSKHFKKTGIHYWQTEQDKSVFYLGLEPLFAQGNIEILDHPELSR